MRLTIGSRGSQLALWQANHVAARLRECGHEVAIKIIQTTGDKIIDVGLAKIGSKGVFTKEIEEALASGDVDLAVHSLKDLPTELASQFVISAIPPREDPRDAFCSLRCPSVEELPAGARVGTSSLRREAQLHAFRADLEVIPLRGNVDTRLRKLESGEYDAIILAAAGLRRLGRTDAISQVLPVGVMCPAAGQGALAIEARAGDNLVHAALSFLNDPQTRDEVVCERALLHSLGGGCQVPIGAHAKWTNEDKLRLQAVVASPDGKILLREAAEGDNPIALGESVGTKLLNQGGAGILASVYGSEIPQPEQP